MPPAAHAAWLSLNDGVYVVTLSCDTSTVIACPSSLQGSLTIAGGSATAMDSQINGDSFVGDPQDGVVDGTLVDTESATLSMLPDFRFLSLRLITDGQIGPYGAGDPCWVYCSNTAPNQCSPNTTGTWLARLLTVSAPGTAALVPLALAGVFGGLARGRRLDASACACALTGAQIQASARARARIPRNAGARSFAKAPARDLWEAPWVRPNACTDSSNGWMAAGC